MLVHTSHIQSHIDITNLDSSTCFTHQSQIDIWSLYMLHTSNHTLILLILILVHTSHIQSQIDIANFDPSTCFTRTLTLIFDHCTCFTHAITNWYLIIVHASHMQSQIDIWSLYMLHTSNHKLILLIMILVHTSHIQSQIDIANFDPSTYFTHTLTLIFDHCTCFTRAITYWYC